MRVYGSQAFLQHVYDKFATFGCMFHNRAMRSHVVEEFEYVGREKIFHIEHLWDIKRVGGFQLLVCYLEEEKRFGKTCGIIILSYF